MKVTAAILGLVLVGCTSNYKMKPVRFDSLFHDSNSKVWLIDKHIVDGVNISPKNELDKKIIIFYADGDFAMLPYRDLDRSQIIRGNYYVNSDEKRLEMTVEKAEWILEMDLISEDSVHMHAAKGSKIQHGIHIIPLPKL